MEADDAARVDELLSEGQGFIDSASTILNEADSPYLHDVVRVLHELVSVRVQIRREFKLNR